MEITHLSSTLNVKTISEDFNKGVFEISGLFPGYGLTLGNALRRALLSSLPGAAVTYIKIKNAPHEFTTLPGVQEDIIEICLNFKKLRFRMHTSEPQTLFLKAKGEKIVTAADIEKNSLVEVVNKDEHIATLTSKNSLLEVEITVERGMGYVPTEARKIEKLPIGTIALDAFFSPVLKVSYDVENMRVGEWTDYNRLIITIETDGTISPSAALRKVSSVLKDHFDKIMEIEVKEFDVETKKEEKAKTTSSKNQKKESKIK